ncbi:aminotransferase class IV [Coraliomargarita sinensis]|uniref:branched-chain-amino-acid transaminase n=1 Tax=Coraliomargarita sinensis TaxID=2174842 RepID=A0A317ZGT3_9BACT|nr:aminotransferase class IV [Coraliomargarita sinensis]PXA02979.1 aminotransferase class IV [Coraliomargarita sinensis]
MSAIKIIFPGELLALNPESSLFAHGFGLFETIRLRAGYLELWDGHWQRLTSSARELGIACPYDNADVLQAVRRLAAKLPIDSIVKLSLFKEGQGAKLAVYSRPVNPPPESVGLVMEGASPINEYSPLAGHKTHNYLENLLVLEAAREAGCFDCLRLNTKGEIAEGAISNLFFLRDGRLHTPSRQSGLLPGVVRQELVQGLDVQEGSYQLSDLRSADAVFLTNSSIGLQPVDWLLSRGEQFELSSRTDGHYQRMFEWLTDRISATSVKI